MKVCARASCNVIFPRFQKATRSRKNCCRTTRLPTKRRRRRWRRRRRRRVGLTRGQIQGGIIIFCDIWQWEVMLYSLYSYMKNDNDMQGEHSCWRSSWSEQSSGKAQSGRWWEKQQQQVETFIAFYEFWLWLISGTTTQATLHPPHPLLSQLRLEKLYMGRIFVVLSCMYAWN